VRSGHTGRRSSLGSSVRGAGVAILNAMAPTTSHASLTSCTLRQCRHALALRADPHALRPLATLARLIHVHVKTLHAAARDGRLRVTYDTRTTFRSLRARATVADADTFLHTYFEQATWPTDRPAPLIWSQIPSDYDDQIRCVRRRLGPHASAVRRTGGCRTEGRRLPMGVSQALSFTAVLAADSKCRRQ
jgi:hypothetical protein